MAFDIKKSTISPGALAAYLQEAPRADLTSIPGLGPAAAALLSKPTPKEHGCETTFQLIGVFLVLGKPGLTRDEHHEAFYDWLTDKGLTSQRTQIVHAVSERVGLLGLHE